MRIAASTYLNSAPLVYSFSQGSLSRTYEFLGDAAPSRCAAMLACGQCEIALIPVIEYQRIPNLRIIPNVAVASKRRVRSVLIASRCPLEQVRKMALDTSSRTSQGLVRILFERRFGSHPTFIERTPDAGANCENMLDDCDAALVIGDPAMKLAAAQNELKIYDLAEEWRTMTGLPFVFAVWAVRGGITNEEDVVRDFVAAKREGQTRLTRIASEYSHQLGLPQTDLLSYLQDNVNYDLDEENIAGMLHYFDLVAESGLIPERRPVEFMSGSSFTEAPIT